MENKHEAFCPCDDCQAKREAWAAQQPPMIQELDSADAEDSLEPPIGSWASVARMMAQGDDSGFDWDAWKDEMKDREMGL